MIVLVYSSFVLTTGREKHRAEREDKSGVGSFEKDNRCLYVGPCFTDEKSQATVERHFQEWGDLESGKCWVRVFTVPVILSA